MTIYTVDRGVAAGVDITVNGAALQGLLDEAAQTGDSIVFQNGVYQVSSLTLTGASDVDVIFESGAWLSPTSGFGLSIVDCKRVRVLAPRVRFDSGSPAGALRLVRSWWTTISDPVVWMMSGAVGTPEGIRVEDNSFWCEIDRARMRRLSGTIANRFSSGIVFDSVSNAGRVNGGSLNDCTVGVLIANANAVDISRTAFEGVGTAIRVADHANNAGLIVGACRFEAVTTCMHVDRTSVDGIPLVWLDNYYVSVGAVIVNPNGYPVQIRDNAHTHLVGNGYGSKSASATFEMTPFRQGDQPAIRVNGRFGTSEQPSFTVSQIGQTEIATQLAVNNRSGADGGTIRATNMRGSSALVLAVHAADKLGIGQETFGVTGQMAYLKRYSDTSARVVVDGTSGGVRFGPGGAGDPDVRVERSSNGGLSLGASAIGFFDRVPIEKPRVSGCDAGSTLQSLIRALAAIGLVSDETS